MRAALSWLDARLDEEPSTKYFTGRGWKAAAWCISRLPVAMEWIANMVWVAAIVIAVLWLGA